MKKAQVLIVLMVTGLLSIPLWGQNEDISASDKETLMYMFEEELMSRDVYVVLGEKWSLEVIDKIKEAELRQIGIIKNEMRRHGIDADEIMLSTEPGVYKDKKLQGYYNAFVSQGMESEESALKVGAMIEEKNITDLKDGIEELDNLMMNRLFISLLNGSERHLRAFVRVLEERGITYEPEILDPVVYGLIIASKDFEPGFSDKKVKTEM